MQDNTNIPHADKVAAIKAICEQSREGKVVANYGVEMAEGLGQLLEQQKVEIAHMAATFDYSVFAGAKGPLSGPDWVPAARNPSLSANRAEDESLFHSVMSHVGSCSDDWKMEVCYNELQDCYFVDLYKTTLSVQMGAIHDDTVLVATSLPFERCEAAVLWAHKFDVPVSVCAEEIAAKGGAQ